MKYLYVADYMTGDFWKPVIEYVSGTVVECNTAYDGARNTTERHEKLMEEHGWTKYFSVQHRDRSWSTRHLRP